MTTPTTPAADSVPYAARHPLEGYALSYEMMSRMGDGKVSAHAVAIDIRGNMIRAATARESALVAERNQLHAIVCQCLAALKNGSGAAPECSIEFLSHAPGEVAAHVGVLVAERDALRAHLAMSRALAAPAVEGE